MTRQIGYTRLVPRFSWWVILLAMLLAGVACAESEAANAESPPEATVETAEAVVADSEPSGDLLEPAPERIDEEVSPVAAPSEDPTTPETEHETTTEMGEEKEAQVWDPDYPKLEKPVSVYVVPIKDAITPPQAYILRRAIKQANELGVEVILLDIDTPGGRLDVTLDIMDILARFEGTTIAFVNDEAISAGAFISVACDHIYMAPTGTIGAAAAISSSGEDIPATMQQKLNSYLNAKIRVLTEEHPMRAEVMRAMMDSSYVLEIDGEILKTEDELLSLTAKEAMRLFGDPPRPLLAEGIYDEVAALLDTRFGEGMYELKNFEVSWSEHLAQWLALITPILIGLGIMCFYIEYQTPGFGVFGIVGIILILVVFSSSFVAGLAGLEPIIMFFAGIAFLAVELFVLPGLLVFGLLGVVCIIGSILWALVDYWPASAPAPEGVPDAVPSGLSFAMLDGPLQSLAIGLVVAGIGIYLVWKLLPHTSIYSRLVLQSSVANLPSKAITSSDPTAIGKDLLPMPGTEGVVLTPLRPMGEVEINGFRYQAKSLLGYVDRGETVVVKSSSDFALNVERKS